MILNTQWKTFLSDELTSDYFIQLQNFVENEYKTKTIFPNYENIFRAFNLLNPNEVKVVIIGQDPYHGVNQANGLAFSVCNGCKIPPSLNNIFKELVSDIGCKYPPNGDLTSWAKQGVFLINSVFTVVQGEANSHKNKGWERFSDAVIKKLSTNYENIVFILWGAPSQKKDLLIDETKHMILKSPHPSPLSSYRGFFGSKPFSKTNNYFKLNGEKEISWCLKE
jgi:uracil-DNA glycosylase